jgi:hypothetical protein
MMDKQEKRLYSILGEDNGRTMQNANRYREYLLKLLRFPVRVTGTEDFPWEEPYVFGGWDEDEYEELKKTQPSYTDTFDLETLAPPDEHEDIVAKLRRLSDGKTFDMALSWLTTSSKKDEAYILLKDYSVWHGNY